MATVFHAKLYARFVEIKSSLKRKKLHRTNQSSNFLGSSFSNRDNVSALDVKKFYSVQYCTQIIRLLAVFGQFFFCVLTSGNIPEIYKKAYFGYLSGILHEPQNLVPNTPYHLTRWRKQICRFVGVIWFENSKMLCNWGCETRVWIVWRYLNHVTIYSVGLLTHGIVSLISVFWSILHEYP